MYSFFSCHWLMFDSCMNMYNSSYYKQAFATNNHTTTHYFDAYLLGTVDRDLLMSKKKRDTKAMPKLLN